MKRVITHSLKVLLKFAACGAIVFAIGWAFLTLHWEVDTSEVEVRESSADIWSLDPVAMTSTQRFAASLEALGHEEPRVYDYNGNTVYFSSRTTDKTPEELVDEYQNEFVRQGLNEKSYSDMHLEAYESRKKWTQTKEDRGKSTMAMLSGQPIPLYVGADYMNMGAAVLAAQPETTDEAQTYLEGQSLHASDWQREFAGFRQIEAFRAPDDRKTWVTAVWSEPDWDMRKHLHHDETLPKLGASPDPDVPSCPGCMRTTRFASKQKKKPYVTNIFKSPQESRSVQGFYVSALTNRGWKETESSALTREALYYTDLAEMRHQMMQFARGEEFMTVMVEPTQDGSMVTTTKTD